MEECPARFVGPALEDLRAARCGALGGTPRLRTARPYGTPRRLAVLVEDVADHQADLRRK